MVLPPFFFTLSDEDAGLVDSVENPCVSLGDQAVGDHHAAEHPSDVLGQAISVLEMSDNDHHVEVISLPLDQIDHLQWVFAVLVVRPQQFVVLDRASHHIGHDIATGARARSGRSQDDDSGAAERFEVLGKALHLPCTVGVERQIIVVLAVASNNHFSHCLSPWVNHPKWYCFNRLAENILVCKIILL